MERIKLNCGKHYALIDDEDYELISGLRWFCVFVRNKRLYAYTKSGDGKRVYLHRFLMKPPQEKQVDHRNNDGLDNQRTNLRLSTFSQNQANTKKLANKTSIYKGVSWHAHTRKWRAMIGLNNSRSDIGYFEIERHAALAYDIWAKEIYGEFASTNF